MIFYYLLLTSSNSKLKFIFLSLNIKTNKNNIDNSNIGTVILKKSKDLNYKMNI